VLGRGGGSGGFSSSGTGGSPGGGGGGTGEDTQVGGAGGKGTVVITCVTADFSSGGDSYLTLDSSPVAGGSPYANLSNPQSNGTVIAIYANASSCYTFSDWTPTTNISNPNAVNTSLTIYGNMTVTANYVLKTYSLNYSAGAGGTLTGTVNQTVNCSSSGSAVTAVPSACYRFVNWNDSVVANPRTDSNVQANGSFLANFAINTSTITYINGSGGGVTGTLSQTINCGSYTTAVTATPSSSCYVFVNWSDSNTSASRTDIATSTNKSFTANFAGYTYTLSTTGNNSGGTPYFTGSSPFSCGAVVPIYANMSPCYTFSGWSPATGIANPAVVTTTITLSANASLTASYTLNKYTLTYTAGAGGTINGTSPQTINCSAGGSVVEAEPDPNFYFVNWSDSSTDNPRTDSNVQSDISVTANFVANPSLTTYAGTGGTVTSPGVGTYQYNYSQSVPLIASASSNYSFAYWSGDVDTVASPSAISTTVTMLENYSITANFAINGTPLIVTESASGLSISGGTLRSTLVGLGNYSPVYVYFQYGLNTSYGTNTSEQTETLGGTVTQAVTSLASGTVYHFRAAVRYGVSSNFYGGDLAFTTLSPTPPTVTTGSAVSITNVSAVLQGMVTSLGSYTPVSSSFEYGVTSAYGLATPDQTVTTPSVASAIISGLIPGQGYHFRVRVKYGSGLVVNGSDATFMALSSNPSVPTSFFASGSGTSVVTTWVKGFSSNNTMVRYSLNGSPLSIAEGTLAYFGSGTTYTLSGVTNNTVYYFSAWSERDGVYSTGYATASSIPEPGAIPAPDTLSITSVMVYEDFLTPGDQLWVVAYQVIYSTEPVVGPGLYFDLDIYDGLALKARGKLNFWGYKPASIYLAPTSALTWEGDYTVQISGIPGKVISFPSTSYSLSGSDWIVNTGGSDFNCQPLDQWVVDTAESIDIYEGTPGELTIFVPDSGTILSNSGGGLFDTAIPNLMEVCPNLFSIVVAPIDTDSIPSGGLPTTGQTSLTNNFGVTVMTAFTHLGQHMGGLSGSVLAGIFWFIIMMIVAGIGTGVSGSSVVGTVVSLPILFIGNYLGVISLALMGVIGTLCVIYLLRQLWLVGQ
jgi:hypothetical protein